MKILSKFAWYRKYMGPEKILLTQRNYEGIILGSTYVYWGMKEFADKYSFLNAALPAQTLSYDKRILIQYKDYINKGGYVLFSLAPCSFLVNEYENLFRSLRYYNVLKKENIYKWSAKRKIKAALLPMVRRLRGINPMPQMLENNPENASRQRIAGWCSEFSISNLSEAATDNKLQNSIEQSIGTLSDMIRIALENKLKPVIIVMPVSKTMKKSIPQEYFQECVIKSIDKANLKKVPVWDLYNSGRLDGDEFYFNSDCLNEKGQAELSKIIQAKILERHEQMNDKMVKLSNGYQLPWISYGTGVVKRYYRNKLLYLKDNVHLIIGSMKKRHINKKLLMDIHGEKIIKRCYDNGFRMFDSARIYGHSEVIVGKGLKYFPREQYFLTTKISDMDVERKLSPNDVAGNFRVSLENLKTDYVDAYLLHWPHGNWIDIYNEMEKIYQTGKTRVIGVCNFKIEHFEVLIKKRKLVPQLCQTELHPLNSKRELREYCSQKGIVLMAHTPTGRMCEKIRSNEVLRSLSDKYGKSVAQIILRWHFQNRVIPVIATTSDVHMKEDLDIFDFALEDDDMRLIESVNENYIMLDADGIDNPNYIYNL